MEKKVTEGLTDQGPVATGLGLTALDPIFRDHCSEVLDDLRVREPVHRDRTFDRVVLSRALDVSAVLSDSKMLSSPDKARPGAYLARPVGASPINRSSFMTMDDPDHKRIRSLVAQAFTPRSVAGLRPQIEAFANQLLDAIPKNQPFDVIQAYAGPLPTKIIATMLGVDVERQQDFKQWSEALVLMLNPARTEDDNRRMREGGAALQRYFEDAIAHRRERPSDDLISRLIAAQENGEQLNEEEIVAACRLLLVAGNVTTTDLIGNTTMALLANPQQRAKWRERPELTQAMIEESLRYDSPLMAISRTAPQGWEIGGCPVAAGQSVTAMIAGANHDPELHQDPHKFDIERARQQHFTFGGGAHYCLGASLARIEGEVAISMLFERFPTLGLSGGAPAARKATPNFNGFVSLWVDPNNSESR